MNACVWAAIGSLGTMAFVAGCYVIGNLLDRGVMW